MVFNQLLSKLQLFKSSRDAANLIDSLYQKELDNSSLKKEPIVVAFANAHAFNLAQRDENFRSNLFHSNVLMRDGIGVELFCRLKGIEHGANLNGTDFIPYYLSQFCKGRSLAIYGTDDDVLNKAVPKFNDLGVRVVDTLNGFYEEEAYVERFNEQNADVVLLAMGMPKQERIAAKLTELNSPLIVICGGAIVDFIGGKVKRAPEWIIKCKCEWLYRLSKEPKRLFHRYVIGNFIFMSHALIATFFMKSERK